MTDLPAVYWITGGVSVAVIVGSFAAVGAHHELIYQWRKRRRARSIFVDLTYRGDPWR